MWCSIFFPFCCLMIYKCAALWEQGTVCASVCLQTCRSSLGSCLLIVRGTPRWCKVKMKEKWWRVKAQRWLCRVPHICSHWRHFRLFKPSDKDPSVLPVSRGVWSLKEHRHRLWFQSGMHWLGLYKIRRRRGWKRHDKRERERERCREGKKREMREMPWDLQRRVEVGWEESYWEDKMWWKGSERWYRAVKQSVES